MKDKRTYADRRDYLIKAVTERRKKIRTMAVKYKGGKCMICENNRCQDALDFHHYKGEKEFGLSKDGITRSWKRVKNEVDKCILLQPSEAIQNGNIG